jgi:hypothetical protein
MFRTGLRRAKGRSVSAPRTTIYEASERDFQIVFVRDATSAVYDRGLEELRGIGVVVQDADECLSWL